MTEDQIKDEISGVIRLIDGVYKQFGFKYHIELSTRPENSMGSDEAWEIGRFHTLCVIHKLLGNRQYLYLYRCKPCRELPRKMLNQNTNETFDRAEAYAVNHNGTLLAAVSRGGMLIYKQDMHSYRDLPIRMGEIGLVHRHEKSGALHGLMRVRCFNQDDRTRRHPR